MRAGVPELGEAAPACVMLGGIHAGWFVLAIVVLVLAWMLSSRRRALSPRRRVRLAVRQDLNGRRLLQMARELDKHAHELRLVGMPWKESQRWASQCRSLAAAHLACINALLLDPRATSAIVQDTGSGQHDDDRRLM